MNHNYVAVGGRLGRDLELRYTPKGAAVADFSMAVNRTWKTESGENKEETSWFSFTAFGRQAQTLAQYVKKGDNLFVTGRLKEETWTDKQTGQKRSKIKIIVEGFQFLPRGAKPADAGGDQVSSRAEAPQPDASGEAPPPPEDDDLPF